MIPIFKKIYQCTSSLGRETTLKLMVILHCIHKTNVHDYENIFSLDIFGIEENH